MTDTTTDEGNGDRRVRNPYFDWSHERYPDGETGHNPPVSAFLASEGMHNAWTSHVPAGADPERLRFDVYLRRRWRQDEGAVCVANLGPAGDDAPKGWDDDAVAMLREALAEVETSAKAAGFARVAVENADKPVLGAFAAMGYEPAEGGDLVKRVA